MFPCCQASTLHWCLTIDSLPNVNETSLSQGLWYLLCLRYLAYSRLQPCLSRASLSFFVPDLLVLFAYCQQVPSSTTLLKHFQMEVWKSLAQKLTHIVLSIISARGIKIVIKALKSFYSCRGEPADRHSPHLRVVSLI